MQALPAPKCRSRTGTSAKAGCATISSSAASVSIPSSAGMDTDRDHEFVPRMKRTANFGGKKRNGFLRGLRCHRSSQYPVYILVSMITWCMRPVRNSSHACTQAETVPYTHTHTHTHTVIHHCIHRAHGEIQPGHCNSSRIISRHSMSRHCVYFFSDGEIQPGHGDSSRMFVSAHTVLPDTVQTPLLLLLFLRVLCAAFFLCVWV